MRPLLLTLALACNPDTGLNPDDTDDVAVDDTATDDTADTEDSADTDTAPPVPSVHFIALGDAGTGNPDQYAVAEVIAEVCARADRGCEFALYLGDNIYDSGVDASDDDQFRTKFEDPYADLAFPFYVVLGNHDLGGDGIGIDFDPNKAQYQIDYTQHSTKWKLFDENYVIPEASAPEELVRFYALNTTKIFFDLGEPQASWLDFETTTSMATWDIAFGHHPYISNGQHGDAGAYEGIPDWMPLADIPRGDHVKEFFDDHVCNGPIDVYFSGHDHNRQWLGAADGCDTEFVVSGAGAKVTDFRQNVNPTEFEDDQTPGFLWVGIEGDTLTAWFYDMNGNEDGPFVIQR